MRDLDALQLIADLLQETLEPVGALRDERLQGADRDRRARPVRQDLRRARVRQMLIADQVDPKRPDPRPVARRRGHARGKARAGQMPALAAALLDPMLNTVQPRHLRQIEHLARLGLHDRLIGQITPAALTTLDRMHNRPIRLLATLKMTTTMPRLTAGLAPRLPSQAPLLVRRLLRIAIRRRRLG